MRSINVGCGAAFGGDYDVYVDRYLKPVSRHGLHIDPPPEKRFVIADAEALPFRDGTFDYAECSNLLEHLENPGKGCAELQRVARGGHIKCPSVFDEILFGKPYHLWMTMVRGNKIWFFHKRPFEFSPFGSAFKVTLKPVSRTYVPPTTELQEIKRVWWKDRADPVIFWHQLDWEGKFDYEEVRE